MLEKEIAQLNESVSALNQNISLLIGVLSGQIEVVGIKEDAAPEPEAEVAQPTPPATISLQELGPKLAEVANKYGAVAQDAIKTIILETGGTQALSQVDPKCLPIIAGKVDAWVAAMEADEAGKRG